MRRWGPLVLIALAGAYALAAAPTGVAPPEQGGHYGLSSLLPALVTLLLVFFTREVVSSLFAGIAVAGFVVRDPNIIDRFLIPSIGSESFALILLVYLWALGGLIGLWTRTGGAQHFAVWAGRKIVRGPRTAKLFAWIMGIVFHQGGTISTILAGTTVRPVTDAEGVSHEELSYIVDSTASPIATVIPLNAWPLYVAGLLVGTTPLFMTEQDVVTFFFRSVPLNFYGLFAITLTLLFALDLLPWEGAKMRAAKTRARTTGELDRAGSEPLAAEELSRLRIPAGYRPGLEDFMVPLGVLIGTALTGVVGAAFVGLRAGQIEVFLASIDVPIAEAFGLAVLSAMVLALLKGMSLRGVVNGFVDGCKGVTIGAIVLALAVTLGAVSRNLGTANFIVEVASDMVSVIFLPALFMGICMAVAFSIGSSWGTYAVVFPLAMPLAWAVNPDPFYLSLCFGAVLGGAVFGDQCSPISDTTILSSLACGSDVMDHVLTQLPLALSAAALGAALATALAAVTL
ncbi:MAG: sodium:proton antiporter [Gemmatimonadetes bacterium]|nr:sodium:proton antiporter [Gemmatimonadota bacterium]